LKFVSETVNSFLQIKCSPHLALDAAGNVTKINRGFMLHCPRWPVRQAFSWCKIVDSFTDKPHQQKYRWSKVCRISRILNFSHIIKIEFSPFLCPNKAYISLLAINGIVTLRIIMKLISLSVSVQYVHLLVSLIIMWSLTKAGAGNTKGGSITVPIDLLFDWFGLDSGLQIKTKIISCHTADSKPVK